MCTALSISERIIRSVNDPFFPESEYERLSHSMTHSWQKQIAHASGEALAFASRHHGSPERAEIGKVLSLFSHQVNGSALTRHFASEVNSSVTSSYHRGKREVNAELYQATKCVRKDNFLIQVVDGMSEFDAINSLESQIIIAAGDFWDSQLQQSLQKEITSWFDGELSREEFAAKLKELVNTRLQNEGQSTLGDHYFDQLAHHSVVRTRTISKFARAKELGAKGYTLVNPMDRRTSNICRTLVARKTVYPLEAAQPVIDDLLTSKTTAELKASQPFWKSPDEERIPVPPLHWGECRTTIRIQFT